MKTLDQAITDICARLHDDDNKVWTRDELKLYAKDGYDTLCMRAEVLYDQAIIPNTPLVGSYGTDLQKDLAMQIPGVRIVEHRINITQDPENNVSPDSPYGGSYDLPVSVKGGQEQE